MSKQLYQPSTLEAIATSKIVAWIASHVKIIECKETHPKTVPSNEKVDIHYVQDTKESEEKSSQDIETVRNYFENVPGLVINNILAEFMAHMKQNNCDLICVKSKKYPPCRWIEALFTKNVTNLSVDRQQFCTYKESFVTKSNMLTGVTTLTLKLSSIYSDLNGKLYSEFAEFLKQMPHIKYLTVTCGVDKLLRCIIGNCRSLVKIEINHCCNLSKNTCDVIAHIPSLKTVTLSMFSLNFCEDESQRKVTRSILKYISSRKQLEIKSYVASDETSVGDLRLIKEYPMIQSLQMCSDADDRQFLENQHCLKILQNLHDLRDLHISKYDFYEDGIKEVIQALGSKIELLRLWDVRNMDFEAFKLISRECPNLKTLIIVTTDELVTDSGTRKRSYSSISDKAEIPLLRKLQKLEMCLIRFSTARHIITNPSRNCSEQIITLFLLENSPNIESIDLMNINLTEDFLFEVLDKNPLRSLKYLRMPIKLDQLIINRIIENGATPEVCFSRESRTE